MLNIPLVTAAFGGSGSGAVPGTASGARSGRVGALRRALAGMFLAGTALAPAAAQVLDLGGGSFSITTPASFAGFTSISNGLLTLNPNSTTSTLNLNIPLTDEVGILTVNKNGPRTVLLSAQSTHSGNTGISNGLLRTTVENALSPNSRLTINNTGVVDVSGLDQTIAALAGNVDGRLISLSLNPVVLTIGGSETATFNGTVEQDAGTITIVKSGTGVQGFTNSQNSFTGGISLLEGALRYGEVGSLGSGAIRG